MLALMAAATAQLTVLPARGTSDDHGLSPRSVLYVWAADEGLPVTLPGSAGNQFNIPSRGDFLAVVDADRASPTYGKVLHTVSVPTLPTGNEAHHVSPFIPSTCRTFVANSLLSDSWSTFDVARPLNPILRNTVGLLQTIGTVPGYSFMLPNCQTLGTETGGALFGSHGTVVRIDAGGAHVVEERSADRIPTDTLCASQWRPVLALDKVGGPSTRKTNVHDCLPSDPLGVSARPDLNTLVTSDYAAPLPLVLPLAPSSDISGFTVRHYDLNPACTSSATPPPATRCIGDPRLVILPDGPRQQANERDEENVAVESVAVTNPAGNLNPVGATPSSYLASRGAFAATTCGGALYYTADVTARQPVWREVFDFSAAAEALTPGARVPADCVGGGGLAVTPDNRHVVATIIGREPGQSTTPLGPTTDGRPFPGMVVTLDVASLVEAGSSPTCAIDSLDEAWSGGIEPDCPRIASIHVVSDPTTGGPHDLAVDYPNGAKRFVASDYFVSQTGVTGDLRICMYQLEDGRTSLDPTFPAAVDGQEAGSGCISFHRTDWPGDRGAGAGPAKPHHGVFRNNSPSGP